VTQAPISASAGEEARGHIDLEAYTRADRSVLRRLLWRENNQRLHNRWWSGDG